MLPQRRHAFALILLLLTTISARPLQATPVARLLRVDPRTSTEGTTPVLTAVIDLTEPKRLSEVVSHCGQLSGIQQTDCESDALEKPEALFRPHPFPAEKVILTVRVDEQEFAAELLSSARWGESHNEPGVGTAWLVVLDADSRGKDGLTELRRVAEAFVARLAPRDLINVIVLGESSVLKDSGWLATHDKGAALEALTAAATAAKSKGRTRPLLTTLRSAVSDALLTLKAPVGQDLPLHQALVVLSSGYGGGDPATTGPGAEELAKYLTSGVFGDAGRIMPRLPMPVISIMTPPSGYDEYSQLARDFMRSLANPEIGGFFSVIRKGQGGHAERIVEAVRSRFASMIIARFRLACVAMSPTQSLSLLFPGTEPAIIGDASFRDVPLGFDPRNWPLDIDEAMTTREVNQAGGVFPGGTFKVFGNFCWGGDTSRPEVYFLPPGETLPKSVSESGSNSAEEIKRRLISLDMRGTAIAANESFAEFLVPESKRLLHGSGERQVARLVIVDRVARRSSGLTDGTVLELRARMRPIATAVYIAGIGAALALLVGAVLAILRLVRRRGAALSTYSGIRIEGSPYVTPAPVSRSPRSPKRTITRATLTSEGERFVILPGTDLRVGRDGSRATALMTHPQVSGLHATFRLEGQKFFVRDESSAHGTTVDGRRIESGIFIEITDEQEIGLGPLSLKVQMSYDR